MAGSTFTGDQITAMQAQVAAATARTGGTPFWNGGKSETRSYIHASYVDDVVAMKRTTDAGSATYFVHSNGLYSTQVLTNAITGAVVEKYSYDAYGKRSAMTATGTALARSAYGWDRGFTGYVLDTESGLYYARARMYSSDMGRFIGRDPLGYFVSFNLYGAHFLSNDVDPSGMAPCQQIRDKIENNVRAMKDIAEKIRNIEVSIARRQGHLDSNPQNLPIVGPPGTPPSRDVAGHSLLVLADLENLAAQKAQLAKKAAYAVVLDAALASCMDLEAARNARNAANAQKAAEDKKCCRRLPRWIKGGTVILVILCISGDSHQNTWDDHEVDLPPPPEP